MDASIDLSKSLDLSKIYTPLKIIDHHKGKVTYYKNGKILTNQKGSICSVYIPENVGPEHLVINRFRFILNEGSNTTYFNGHFTIVCNGRNRDYDFISKHVATKIQNVLTLDFYYENLLLKVMGVNFEKRLLLTSDNEIYSLDDPRIFFSPRSIPSDTVLYTFKENSLKQPIFLANYGDAEYPFSRNGSYLSLTEMRVLNILAMNNKKAIVFYKSSTLDNVFLTIPLDDLSPIYLSFFSGRYIYDPHLESVKSGIVFGEIEGRSDKFVVQMRDGTYKLYDFDQLKSVVVEFQR